MSIGSFFLDTTLSVVKVKLSLTEARGLFTINKMARLILFRYLVKRKRLNDLQLKELAKYLFTLSSLGIGSVLVKFFEAEKFALDRNALSSLVLVLGLALILAYIAIALLGKIQD